MQILWSDDFDLQAEKLSRKHRSIYDDIDELIQRLEDGERPGYFLRGVDGLPLKWTRLGIRSARKGKRGGFRVIYYLGDQLILLVMIDTRPDMRYVPPARILRILEDAGLGNR